MTKTTFFVEWPTYEGDIYGRVKFSSRDKASEFIDRHRRASLTPLAAEMYIVTEVNFCERHPDAPQYAPPNAPDEKDEPSQ